MAEPPAALRAAMGMPSLEELLGMLGGPPDPVGPKSVANVTVAQDDRIDELSGDGINEERYGYADQRRVAHIPEPQGFQAQVENTNVTHVPVSAPVQTEAFKATVPVIKNTVFTDNSKRDMQALERGANQDFRREGNFAAMVLAVVGLDEADAVAVPLQGMLTRIAIAICSAETGATASLCPNLPGWDVRVTSLELAASAMRRRPEMAPVFIPADMPKAAAEALISLSVPGGPASYGWRYRPGADGTADIRAGDMPSYVRKYYPGGNLAILVVTERAAMNWTFGGAALSTASLHALEVWVRAKYGHGLVDQAFKTAAAFGHVYVEPTAHNRDLGEKFELVRATTIHQGRDYGGVNYRWRPGGLLDEGNLIIRQPELDENHRPVAFDTAVLNAHNAINPGRVVPVGTRPLYLVDAGRVEFHWRANNRNHVADDALGDILGWVMDPANLVDGGLRQFAMSWAATTSAQLYALYGDEDRDVSRAEPGAFRDTYGFLDEATFVVPEFSLRAVAPVIAGVHLVNAEYGLQSGLDPGNRRSRLRNYVGKMHIAHVFACVGKNVWPEMLDFSGYTHARMATLLPRGLQPLAYLSNAGRHFLAAPNWQLLEPVHRLRGSRLTSAYYGYNVPGTWQVKDNGYVNLNDPTTSIPGIDAAMRTMWNFGGTVDVVSPQAQPFVAVLDANGLVAPLAFAPVAKARRLVSVEVGAGLGGADSIGAGSNHNLDAVISR